MQHYVAACSDTRPRGDVAAVEVQQVDDHEERWRRDGRGVGLAQPLEVRPQLLVVDHNLAVEHQRARGQLGYGRGLVGEPARSLWASILRQ